MFGRKYYFFSRSCFWFDLLCPEDCFVVQWDKRVKRLKNGANEAEWDRERERKTQKERSTKKMLFELREDDKEKQKKYALEMNEIKWEEKEKSRQRVNHEEL